jgi:polysaccharide chain length determinant protein (PEP-CTERM system associated)
MSADFRQRTPAEYLKILRRRKWLIILPVVAVVAASSYAIYKLPDVYKSSTLIVVKPSTLPQSVIPMSTEDALTRQLAGITQVVTSRSSLEPLIEKYELYKAERLRGEPMESIFGMVGDDIKVDINTTRNDITNGFDISFRYRDPRIARAVTSELAARYVDEQNTEQINSTKAALGFINNQVEQTKGELDAIDGRRLEFMQKNLLNLPSSGTSLLGQLTSLRDQQRAQITELGRLQDRRSSLAAQLTLMEKQAEQMIDNLSQDLTDPKTTPAWAELVNRKAELQGEYQRLLTEYKPKHPDVVAKKAQIESVDKDMDLMLADWKARIEERKKRLENRPDLQLNAMKLEIKNLDAEIGRQQRLQVETEKTIQTYTDRINSVPGAEVALGALDREYATKKEAYDKLLNEQQKIELAAKTTQEQQAQGIQVVDPANLPGKPVAPKRLLLVSLALGAGLVLGLLLAGIFEVPLLMTIQTAEDARHYTGLPVLIAVPELMTPQEARSLPRRRRLLLAAGVVATMVSIPLLALALRLSHVFELVASGRG